MDEHWIATLSLSQKEFIEWKHIDCLVKKTLQAGPSVKELMMTVFLDIKGLITIDFLEKSAIVNNAFNYQVIR